MLGSKILATGIKQSGLLKGERSSEYLEKKEEEKAPRVQRTVQMTAKAWAREQQQQQQQWG
jgi:hypothetical protein